jgi:hypothetical protein
MRPFLIRLLKFFIGVVLVFFAAEIGYRLKLRFSKASYQNDCMMKKTYRYAIDPELLVELRPGIHVAKDNVLIATNRFGYRDDEWSAADTTKKRVLLLGDSVAFPMKLNHEKGFEYQAERILREYYHMNVEIMNLSCLGYNALQHIQNIKKYDSLCAKQLPYDYILVNVTQDDWQPTGKPAPLTWIDAPGSPYHRIPSRLLKRGIELYYYKQVFPQKYNVKYLYALFNFLKSKQDQGIKIRAFSIPKLKKANSMWMKDLVAYNDSATKLNYNFLDSDFSHLPEKSLDSMYLGIDDMHLSEKGHEFVAGIIAKWISNDLK